MGARIMHSRLPWQEHLIHFFKERSNSEKWGEAFCSRNWRISVWSQAMLIVLRAKNKLALIDGSCRRPELTSPTLLHWERCNAIVLSWIMNSMSKEIFGGIVYSTDAVIVWNDLKECFDKLTGSRMFSIYREFGRLTQGSTTISTYYSKLRQLWDEFGSLVALPICDFDSARKYIEDDQQHKLLQFLMGLNDKLFQIRSQILIIHPLTSIGQAFAILSQEEFHSLMSVTSLVVEPASSTFYSNKGQNENRKKPLIMCEYCHWTGHTKENCYKLIGYPLGHRLIRVRVAVTRLSLPRMVLQNAPNHWEMQI